MIMMLLFHGIHVDRLPSDSAYPVYWKSEKSAKINQS